MNGIYNFSCEKLQRNCERTQLFRRASTMNFEFEFIGVLRHMQRYVSHICDGTDVQAD